MPSAIAPLETRTKDVSRRSVTAAARLRKMSPPPASVRDPILTTTRRARSTAARGSAMGVQEQIVEGGIDAEQEPLRDPRRRPEQRIDERGHRVALVVGRRDLA